MKGVLTEGQGNWFELWKVRIIGVRIMEVRLYL
jgi:hypothetical protein